jgi:predicted lipase
LELSETRALNRVLRRVLLPYLYEEYEKNIAGMTKEERALLSEYVSDFGRVSAEEMTVEGEGEQQTQIPLITNEEMEQIKNYIERILSSQTMEELEDVGKEIKEASLDLTDTQTTKLRDAYKNRKATIEKKEKQEEKG